MVDIFYDALLNAPTKGRLFGRVVQKDAKEIVPNFFDSFKDDYRRICEEWKEKNPLVRMVLNKETTFSEEVENTISGKYEAERYELVDQCVGPASSAINPAAQAGKYGGIGALLGGGGHGAFAYGYSYFSDLDLKTVISRRSYIKWMAICGASLFGVGGGLFGYFGSLGARDNFRERARHLDQLLNNLYAK